MIPVVIHSHSSVSRWAELPLDFLVQLLAFGQNVDSAMVPA